VFINLTMLHPIMLNWIMDNVDSCFVVTEQRHKTTNSYSQLSLCIRFFATKVHTLHMPLLDTLLLHYIETLKVMFYSSMTPDYHQFQMWIFYHPTILPSQHRLRLLPLSAHYWLRLLPLSAHYWGTTTLCQEQTLDI